MKFLEKFQQPDAEYSVLAFWFLNGELKKQELIRQLEEMTEKGVRGGFMHPRAYLKTPYLEDEWWEAIRTCVETARKIGFYPWLYDEYAWPSGTAGSTFEYGFQKPSRILTDCPEHMAKGLYARVFETKPDDWDSSREQADDTVFKVIEKDERYYVFYRRVFSKAVDYLNPEAIARFIRLTHEEYKKRFGKDFGTLIPGIFFDEIFLAGNPLPWTDGLEKTFYETFGYSLTDRLPSLLEGDSLADQQVRADYYALLGTLYETAFFKQISDWCRENNLQLTGHTEEFLWEHPRRQGDYFKTMRHLMIPGSDCHDYRYRYPRRITYCEPKYSVSVARAYGKKRVLTEAMGGAGWNCSLEEFKKGINALTVMGSNLFVLHGFYYECEHQGAQSDWPSSFFYQNPYWKYFKTFADYISRISYLNSVGRAVVDYAVLYPAEDMQRHMVNGEQDRLGTAISREFHKVLEGMIENQLDTDMIDQEGIRRAECKNGMLCVGDQQFRLLLLPCGTILSPDVETILAGWQAAGGHIVFFETAPGAVLPEGLRHCPAVSAKRLPELAAGLAGPAAAITDGKHKDILVSRRRTENTDYYLFANNGDENREFTVRFDGCREAALWDPETGQKRAAVYEAMEAKTTVTMTLARSKAVYVVLSEAAEAVWSKPQPREIDCEYITGKWEFLPLDKRSDSEWNIAAQGSEIDIPVADFTSDLSADSERIRICNMAGQDGRCERHLHLWEAAWITRRASWNDQLEAPVLYFRKHIYLKDKVRTGRVCLAAVDEVWVFVNGTLVFAGESNGEPVEFDMPPVFKQGDNLIAVCVKNRNPLNDVYVCSAEELPKDRFISLLLEGELLTAGKPVKIKTDKTWLVNDKEEAGWQQADAVLARPFDVQKIKNFNHDNAGHGWILAWERGRPPLLPWGGIPLFGQTVSYPRELYYTFVIPAGAVSIKKPSVSGAAIYLLDGKPVTWEQEEKRLSGDPQKHILTIQVTAQSGGDGVKKPLRVVFKRTKSQLEDWQLKGLDWFSGRALYQNSWNLKKQAGIRYLLDLGQVNHCAEVWVNGILADTLLWHPYRTDITAWLNDGDNEIVVIVANLASNERRYMLVDEGLALGWNRYWNQDNMDRDSHNYVSGLLGPVRLIQES